MATHQRGQHLERLALALFESQGYLVERAQNVIRWLPDPERPGVTRPVSLHHDLFRLWDAIAVAPDGRRLFYQVTTDDNFHARRMKILSTSFPVGPEDLILAHRRGTRIFRVAHGPNFLLPEAVDWEAPSESQRRRLAIQRRA